MDQGGTNGSPEDGDKLTMRPPATGQLFIQQPASKKEAESRVYPALDFARQPP